MYLGVWLGYLKMNVFMHQNVSYADTHKCMCVRMLKKDNRNGSHRVKDVQTVWHFCPWSNIRQPTLDLNSVVCCVSSATCCTLNAHLPISEPPL